MRSAAVEKNGTEGTARPAGSGRGIRLVEPAAEYAAEIWQMRQEILVSDAAGADKFAGCGTLEACRSAGEWIAAAEAGKSEKTCPAGKVPFHIYIAVRDMDRRIVGITDLRHHIDHPVLGTWGGHIGYTVRPSERGQGYAKEMLRLNLRNCEKLNIGRVLITCGIRNLASEKVILANGGVFESELETEDGVVKRFWISLGEMEK